MKKSATIIFTLLVGGGLLLFGGCRHGHYDGDSHIDFVIDYLDEVLDLDQAQQAQLVGIKKEMKAKADTLQASKKEMHSLFKEQLAGEIIDTERVKAAIAEHRLQFDHLIDPAVDHLAAFHATLTPEQRQKLIAKLEKMEKWHN